MNIDEYAQHILLGETLEHKLFNSELPGKEACFREGPFLEIPKRPGRSPGIGISDKQIKFPKVGALQNIDSRGKALHFFANHELMAIEMMAAAILKYPTRNEEDLRFKEEIVKTIQDEQKHFLLYSKRMNDFGVEFGDFPINDFFWRQIHGLENVNEFYAVVALTFEAANLDFAKFYSGVFKELNDVKTSSVLDIVYKDEIVHVSRGSKWLGLQAPNKGLWDYYRELLPEKITPARGKGQVFDRAGRLSAGLELDFIDKSESYSDDFQITNRKNWK